MDFELIPGAEIGPKDGLNFEYTWQDDAVETCLLSNVGHLREHNEDCCAICVPADPEVAKTYGILLAVADGMGGASAGEIASHMALRTVVNEYFHGDPERDVPAALRLAIKEANTQVFKEAKSNPDYKGMGTTISAVVIKDGWAYIGQVGDSRVYLKRPQIGLRQLTRDHSWVADKVRSGEMTLEEAENSTQKNLITRAIGIKKKVKVDLFHMQLVPGDQLMLCSDGLCGYVDNEGIDAAMQAEKIPEVSGQLVQAALDAGGFDNATVVTLSVNRVPGMEMAEAGGGEAAGAAASAIATSPATNDAAQRIAHALESIQIDLDDDSGHAAYNHPYVVSDEEGPDYLRAGGMIAMAAAGVLLLYFAGSTVWGMLGSAEESAPEQPAVKQTPPPTPPPENKALELWDDGAAYPEVYRTARSALEQHESANNKEILETVRSRFIDQVNELLNRVPFSQDDLDEAYSMARRAAMVDPSEEIDALLAKVETELNYHKFLLISTDRKAGTATFRLNNPDYPEREQTVSEGELLQERFRVVRVMSSSVRLVDTEVEAAGGPRRLIARPMTPVGEE